MAACKSGLFSSGLPPDCNVFCHSLISLQRPTYSGTLADNVKSAIFSKLDLYDALSALGISSSVVVTGSVMKAVHLSRRFSFNSGISGMSPIPGPFIITSSGLAFL